MQYLYHMSDLCHSFTPWLPDGAELQWIVG